MSKRFFAVFTSALIFTAAPAIACTSLQEAMGHFEEVKNAYIAKAPTMSPEQFPIWTGYLETFGTAMGKSDFTGACAALDAASAELGFGAAAAAPAVPNPPQPATASTEGDSQELAPPAQPAQPAAGGGALTTSGSGSSSGGLLGNSGSGGQSGSGLVTGGQSSQQPPADPTPAIADAGEPAWVECPRGRCWLRE